MSPKGIEIIILEKKEGKVLIGIGKQIIKVNADCLPAKASEGEKFRLYFLNSEEAVTEKKLAKTILEEILNGK